MHITKLADGQERNRVVRGCRPGETKKQIAQNTEREITQEKGAVKVTSKSQKVKEKTIRPVSPKEGIFLRTF